MESSTYTPEDIKRIADLHLRSLPDSLLTGLGRGVLRLYYEAVARSPLESLLVEREGIEILGACVVSTEPKSMTKRLLVFNCPIPLGFNALLALASAKRRAKILSTLFSKSEPPADTTGLPELVQIFIAEAARNKQVGSRLLRRAEKVIKEKGHLEYFLKTAGGNDNAAIHFYEKRGFLRIGQASFAGRPYVYFMKRFENLPPADPICTKNL